MAGEPEGRPGRVPRMAELFGDDPGPDESRKSPTIFEFPAVVDFMKVAGQPVAGPWPPHQQPRPDPEDEAGPVAIVEPPRREG
jgi:hypothetical protein